jgi:hypothetical protein
MNSIDHEGFSADPPMALLKRLQVRALQPHEYDRAGQLLQREHYLGDVPQGHQWLQAVESDGQWVALLDWGPVTWKLADREEWIGWTAQPGGHEPDPRCPRPASGRRLRRAPLPPALTGRTPVGRRRPRVRCVTGLRQARPAVQPQIPLMAPMESPSANLWIIDVQFSNPCARRSADTSGGIGAMLGLNERIGVLNL